MTSKTYLFIQRSPKRDDNGPQDPPSPAQMEEMYARFTAWSTKFKDNIVDMGGKLMGGRVVSKDGVADGPFVESKEIVGGFMIVRAASLEEATQVAQESPGVMPAGSSVEIREISAT
ncbi:MAG: YciI family protein [Pseudomonadota bacterium]